MIRNWVSRVFDLDLIFQKLFASFESLKNDVKDMIYSVIGTGAIMGKVSNFVWDMVKKYGFGWVERIISWFNDDEQRKDDLGEI